MNYYNKGRWLALALVLIGLAGSVWLAEAHVELVASNPAPGATLEDSPRRLSLTFSGPITQAEARLLRGSQVLTLALRVNPEAPQEAIGDLPDTLEPGVYQVIWDITAEDGHQLTGSYSFEVLPAPSPAPLLLLGLLGVSLGLLVALLLLYRWRSYAKHPA
jgi:methionine-rich copper-binding protein CopC